MLIGLNPKTARTRNLATNPSPDLILSSDDPNVSAGTCDSGIQEFPRENGGLCWRKDDSHRIELASLASVDRHRPQCARSFQLRHRVLGNPLPWPNAARMSPSALATTMPVSPLKRFDA